MKRTLAIVLILISLSSFAQEASDPSSELTIIFDSGLLLGHSNEYYPAPFSSNLSFLKNFNDRIWIGGGTGAEILGKTFLPVFADFRYIPFKKKPFYLYEKAGYTFCANKQYTSQHSEYNYYNIYPHPLNEDIATYGGIMNEMGVGILLAQKNWKTSISIGYRYMKTKDKQTNSSVTTYLNTFNRMGIRIGFWF